MSEERIEALFKAFELKGWVRWTPRGWSMTRDGYENRRTIDDELKRVGVQGILVGPEQAQAVAMIASELCDLVLAKAPGAAIGIQALELAATQLWLHNTHPELRESTRTQVLNGRALLRMLEQQSGVGPIDLPVDPSAS